MSGLNSSAVTTLRLTYDAWRTGDASDLRLLKGLLSEAKPEELRSAVQAVCRLAVGLAVVLEEGRTDFTFDEWLADEALAGVAGDAA